MYRELYALYGELHVLYSHLYVQHVRLYVLYERSVRLVETQSFLCCVNVKSLLSTECCNSFYDAFSI